MSIFACLLVAALASPQPPSQIQIDPQAIIEILPLAKDAIEIQMRANEREAQHVRELAKRGLKEVPPCASERYVMDVGIFGEFAFDDWGEFYIDRRFISEDEMKTVNAIESWFQKWFGRAHHINPIRAKVVNEVPVFRGFEDAHYQRHDKLIKRLVDEFNANKMKWCGGTAEQAKHIEDLKPALIKSQMIEESGGMDAKSMAAWAVDPLQVNVPGDWGDEKLLLGLEKPDKRNTGTVERNLRAGIMYLVRKGFGTSGLPASEREDGCFDGWREAFRRYNGRRDLTATERYYSHEYADKIIRRASKPDEFVAIEIFLSPQSQKK